MALESTETNTPKVKRRPGRPPKTVKPLNGSQEALPIGGGVEPGMALTPSQEDEVLEADSPVWVTKAKKLGRPPLLGGPRDRIATWLMLRAVKPDLTLKAAAEELGITRGTLSSDIIKAVEQGWLRFDDSMDQLRYQVIPKTIRNINHFLDIGDRQVTIETAKGTVFKQFAEAEGFIDSKQTTILALKLEMPETPQGQEPLILTGKIVGQPKEID